MIQREINFQQVLQKCLKSDLSFTQPLNKQNIGGDDRLIFPLCGLNAIVFGTKE